MNTKHVAYILVALMVVVVFASPTGSWLQSLVGGSGVRWQDAYVALDAAEMHVPQSARERERLLIALAHAENATPIGLEVGPRLHERGTAALLRYETIDDAGRTLAMRHVRAILPEWPRRSADEPECDRECAEVAARSGGVPVEHGGLPGISSEWLRRMPVGRSYELEDRSLTVQDVFEQRPEDLTLPAADARFRVTLLGACPGRLRLGSLVRLELLGDGRLPLPTGFRTLQWVQHEGCAALLRAPLPASATEPVATTQSIANLEAGEEEVSLQDQPVQKAP